VQIVKYKHECNNSTYDLLWTRTMLILICLIGSPSSSDLLLRIWPVTSLVFCMSLSTVDCLGAFRKGRLLQTLMYLTLPTSLAFTNVTKSFFFFASWCAWRSVCKLTRFVLQGCSFFKLVHMTFVKSDKICITRLQLCRPFLIYNCRKLRKFSFVFAEILAFGLTRRSADRFI